MRPTVVMMILLFLAGPVVGAADPNGTVVSTNESADTTVTLPRTSASPSVLPVDTVNSGTMYFGGTKLTPPYSIGIDLRNNHLVINGYQLTEPVDSAANARPSCEDAALAKAIQLGPELYRNGKAKGKSDEEILTQWRNSSLKIPCIGQVFTAGRQIKFVTANGLPIIVPLPEEHPRPRPSEKARAVRVAQDIANTLREGYVLFITPNGGMVGTDKRHTSAFETVVDKVRNGIPLGKIDIDGDGIPDLEESSLLPEDCQQLIRKPAKLTLAR